MRVMFTLTGLLILIAVVCSLGGAGIGTLSHVGAAVKDAVTNVTPAVGAETRPANSAAGIARNGDVEASRSRDVPDTGNLLKVRRQPTAIAEGKQAQAATGKEASLAAELKDSTKDVNYRVLPDGVSQIKRNPDGSFRSLLCKGTSVIPAVLGLRGERIALSRANLRAKALLSQYMCEHISAKTTDNNRVEFKVTGDSAGGTHEGGSESFDTEDTIVLTSEAILRGVVTLHQEIVAEKGGQLSIVVLGISSKTLALAMELQGVMPDSGVASPVVRPENIGSKVEEQKAWGIRSEDRDEMGF